MGIVYVIPHTLLPRNIDTDQSTFKMPMPQGETVLNRLNFWTIFQLKLETENGRRNT
jgi:hypothetical protein